jgi:hypothetical protein
MFLWTIAFTPQTTLRVRLVEGRVITPHADKHQHGLKKWPGSLFGAVAAEMLNEEVEHGH